MMLIFLHVDKHQSFLQVDLNILGIKVYYKLILSTKHSESTQTQLAQRRCDNVVTTSLLTLSQRCGTVENESCADVDVATTLLQRRHNIKHWISRPFYYRLF